MMGTGNGSKSVVWVALRIPDDAICAHANQSRIGKFNMKDKKNVLYSKNVVSYARKMGWFTGKDSDFSWKHTYASPDFQVADSVKHAYGVSSAIIMTALTSISRGHLVRTRMQRICLCG